MQVQQYHQTFYCEVHKAVCKQNLLVAFQAIFFNYRFYNLTCNYMAKGFQCCGTCTRAKPIWDLIENVILGDDNITHDTVIFGCDGNNVLIFYPLLCIIFIKNGWCTLLKISLENKQYATSHL